MIRAYRKTDVVFIAEKQKKLNIYHIGFNKNYYFLSGNSTRQFCSYIKNRLRDKNFRIFLAENKGVIIGYVMGWIQIRSPIYSRRRIGYLSNIYVDNNFRSSGIGKQLYFVIEKWFKKRNVDFIEIKTNIKNSDAIKKFRNYGFKDLNITFYKKVKK